MAKTVYETTCTHRYATNHQSSVYVDKLTGSPQKTIFIIRGFFLVRLLFLVIFTKDVENFDII